MQNKIIRFDIWLLIPVAILLVISLITIYSINPVLFRSQSIAIILSIFAFLIFSQVNLNAMQEFAFPLYAISLVLLGIVLIIGIESHGATRWIQIFGASLQFSEILKPVLTLAFATFLSRRSKNVSVFIKSLVLLFPVLLFVYFQPDLGNALILAGVAILMMVAYGFSYLWFLLFMLPVGLLSPLFWQMLHEYQKQRILTFIYPQSDPLGTSYNVIQAIIAVGSGKFLGKGLGESTQSGLRFLPERHTDFIFATISEELGFLGSMLIIISFFFLLYKIYQIFSKSETTFEKLFCAGAFSFLLIHFFVNVGMNLGIVPIVGVTLPFVSFGGSSMISNFIFLGILSSISMSNRKSLVLEIR